MRIRFAILLLALGPLYCHHSHAQLSADQLAQSNAALNDAKQCLLDLNNDPKLVRMLPKVGLIYPGKDYQPSIELLGNKSKATKEDKAAISYWGEARQQCDRKFFDAVKERFTPEALALSKERRQQIFLLLAKLYSGDLSFGEFNAERQVMNATTNRLQNELASREKAKREQQDKDAAAIRAESDRRNAEAAQRDEAERQQRAQQEQQRIYLENQQRLQAAGLALQAQQMERDKQAAINAEWDRQIQKNEQQRQQNLRLMFPKTTDCTGQWVGSVWQTKCR